MKRIEFKLSMPHRCSWNGRWAGSDSNYTITENVTDKKSDELMAVGSWRYSFGDGWEACVSARIVPKGERVKKSAGFCGYNWMVQSIRLYNEIRIIK